MSLMQPTQVWVHQFVQCEIRRETDGSEESVVATSTTTSLVYSCLHHAIFLALSFSRNAATYH